MTFLIELGASDDDDLGTSGEPQQSQWTSNTAALVGGIDLMENEMEFLAR